MSKTKASLRATHDTVAEFCCQIEDLFKPGAKVTILVRSPQFDKEPHSASMLVSNDSLEEVRGALEYLKKREETHL